MGRVEGGRTISESGLVDCRAALVRLFGEPRTDTSDVVVYEIPGGTLQLTTHLNGEEKPRTSVHYHSNVEGVPQHSHGLFELSSYRDSVSYVEFKMNTKIGEVSLVISQNGSTIMRTPPKNQ